VNARDTAEDLRRIRALVDEQAEDEGLWTIYPRAQQPIGEAYLQQELRRLHTLIEEVTPSTPASDRCPACHDVGWYLDYSGGGHVEPLTLELLPCIHPECKASGRRIEHLSVNEVGFNRTVERGGHVMAVGRG